jgi:hypothetical protein
MAAIDGGAVARQLTLMFRSSAIPVGRPVKSRSIYGHMNGGHRWRSRRSPIDPDVPLVGLCGSWSSEPPTAAMCGSAVVGAKVGSNDRVLLQAIAVPDPVAASLRDFIDGLITLEAVIEVMRRDLTVVLS